MRAWYAKRTLEQKRQQAARLDRERVREADRLRYQTPARKAVTAARAKAWALQYPEKAAAQTAVGNAVRDGRLEKEACLFCDSLAVHGHHHDYSQPLAVTWLCPSHHAVAHGRVKRGRA